MTINSYASDDSGSDYLHYLLDTEGGEDEAIITFVGAAAPTDSISGPSFHIRDQLDWDAHVAKFLY